MSLRVMICDDAMFMRSLIGRALAAVGCEIVAEVGRGPDAIERYPVLQPDLVTMDLVMPEMTGVDATRAIRAIDGNARVLVISAVGQDKMVTEALNAGASGFLTKPFSEAQLLQKVREITATADRTS